MFPAFFEHQYAGGDAGAVEDIGGEADDGIEPVLLFNQVAADMAFGSTAKQDAVGQYHGHGAVFAELVEHVLYKGEVGFGFGGESAVPGKTVVRLKQFIGAPLGGEGRVSDHRLEAFILVLRVLQGIFLFQIEVTVVDAVENHVHACQVVGGVVHLLAVEVTDVLHLTGDPQQQRTGTAGGVVDRFDALFAGGDDARQYGGDGLGGVELAGLFTRATGELTNQVFVGVAEDNHFRHRAYRSRSCRGEAVFWR